MRYIQTAAELGNGEAWREMALVAQSNATEGSSLQADAVEYFDKAVSYGSKAAYLDAALCRFNGFGCEKDEEAEAG